MFIRNLFTKHSLRKIYQSDKVFITSSPSHKLCFYFRQFNAMN